MELRPLPFADTILHKLRTAILKFAWSNRQPLANVGALLCLLYGPPGCNPAFCVVWFRFLMLRRYLAYRPGEVPGLYRLLDSVAEGCPGHSPARLLVESAADIGFQWDSRQLGWERLGLPVLSNKAGPVRHFRSAVLEAWRGKVTADLCIRMGFRGGPWLDLDGTWWSLHVPYRFCGGADGEGHLFCDCTFPPLVEIRKHPEFHGLTEMDKSCWPWCLLWHGWLPLLSGVNCASPWAENHAEGAGNLLECVLGSETSGLLAKWQLLVVFGA